MAGWLLLCLTRFFSRLMRFSLLDLRVTVIPSFFFCFLALFCLRVFAN